MIQPFFADAPPLWGDITFNTVMLRLVAATVFVYYILAIRNLNRRTPSLDKELTTFATRQELEALEETLTERGDERRREIEEKIKDLGGSLSKQMHGLRDKMEAATLRESVDLQAIRHQLGKITGWIEAQGNKPHAGL